MPARNPAPPTVYHSCGHPVDPMLVQINSVLDDPPAFEDRPCIACSKTQPPTSITQLLAKLKARAKARRDLSAAEFMRP
jgi:hypothetical protein